MSFLKKMTKEFEELKSNFLKDDDKKEEKKEENKEEKKEKSEGHERGLLDQQGQPPYGQQSSYGQPPQQPSPSWGPPAANSLPSGWDKQWDQNSQRWYYIEKATGRTQWDPPVASPGYLPLGHEAPRGNGGYGGGYGGGYNQPTPGPVPGGQYGQQYPVAEQKKDKGHGGMMAGAAGGLAVGAIGGALVTHALDDDSSDEEHHHRAAVVAAPQAGYNQEPQYYAQQPGYNQQPSYVAEPGPPGILPDETASGSSVSSSDKEDVQEAREEYENASASDKEEAREEYVEEYEETYD